MSRMDALQRELINRFQGGFPLAGRPFSSVAAKLGTRETTLIQSLRELLAAGQVSRFGPLYDAARLGGAVSLAAMCVPEARFEAVAETVNAETLVAHNYRREHRLNMWFVAASDRAEDLPAGMARIAAATGLPVYDFPKLREYRLGLQLRLAPDASVETVPVEVARPPPAKGFRADALDLALVRATQAGLPVEREPYHRVARSLGVDVATVLQRLARLRAAGVIRRIGLIPNHYRLGLHGNAMTVWDVPDEQVDRLGALVGALDFVSHCYRRPRHPGVWRYNLFAMVHGQDRATAAAKARRIATLLGAACADGDALFSTRILKKSGLRLAA